MTSYAEYIGERMCKNKALKDGVLCKTILRDIGLSISDKRKKLGITQIGLAGMLDMKQPFIARIEIGKQNITMKTLLKLSGCLDIGFTFGKVSEKKERKDLIDKYISKYLTN